MAIHRGDIYYADLRPVIGSEQCQPPRALPLTSGGLFQTVMLLHRLELH